MLSDFEIAHKNGLKPIKDIARKLGVEDDDLMPYGDAFGKVNLKALARQRRAGSGARSDAFGQAKQIFQALV